MPKIIIAIDGYSSCGKSSTAKSLAAQLGYGYIDTGAMYRAVSLYFHQHYVSRTNPHEVEKALADIHISFQFNPEKRLNETYLNGLCVEEEIRKMYISQMVSEVSAVVEVRRAMVALQQRMGKHKGIVMDGRDIGTVVFPQAELKVFMTADPLIRAQRRQAELLEKGDLVDLNEVLENLTKRDHIDMNRSEGPLRQAEDARVLDNSYLTFDEQVALIKGWADEKIAQAS
ncbi:(d)CMP kinase [Siphonobacter curvatus]|uniref:Cytidylate kinase n=1 Tax=Siphonobacter curvatus TaxID=2094562 RepID=A0A2S7IM22_9BACT|nr:(d)CMP kinase [Siphonobacter curvatus]PQA58696.1 (d)CMP kinase [Siphonobacter curvatus]